MKLGQTTVVTVGYNSAEVIGTMLDSVPEYVPVVVVDNASTDTTVDVVQSKRPTAKIVSMSENEGFGRACNLGAENVATRYILFLNPDASLKPNALEELEEAASENGNLAAANPMILNGKGNARLKTSSVMHLPKDLPKPQLEKPSQMPVLMGGAFFVRTEVFDAVGGFDPGIFLYHEDHDLSLRIARNGGQLWHIPTAVVTHVAGTGAKRSIKTARFKGFHMARSRVYVVSKDGAKAAWLRTLVTSILGLIAPHNLLSARRRAKYLGQIQGAWSARQDKGKYQPE